MFAAIWGFVETWLGLGFYLKLAMLHLNLAILDWNLSGLSLGFFWTWFWSRT
jgi:hypothetical protein